MAEYDSYGDPVEEIQNDGSGGNFLTKKYGPLPVWGWTILAAASVFVIYRYTGLFGTSTGSATTTSNTTLPAATGDILNGGDSGQTPEETSNFQDLWDALSTINDTLAGLEPIAPIEPGTPDPVEVVTPGGGSYTGPESGLGGWYNFVTPPGTPAVPGTPSPAIIPPVMPSIKTPTLISHAAREVLYKAWLKALPKNSQYTGHEKSDAAWWDRYKAAHNVKEK